MVSMLKCDVDGVMRPRGAMAEIRVGHNEYLYVAQEYAVALREGIKRGHFQLTLTRLKLMVEAREAGLSN